MFLQDLLLHTSATLRPQNFSKQKVSENFQHEYSFFQNFAFSRNIFAIVTLKFDFFPELRDTSRNMHKYIQIYRISANSCATLPEISEMIIIAEIIQESFSK